MPLLPALLIAVVLATGIGLGVEWVQEHGHRATPAPITQAP